MQNRWAVLALLFTVRLAIGFQFQAVGAVSPVFMQTFGVTLADIGLIISLYHAPGIAFALPGGEIGRRLGDKTVVLAALGFMSLGGLAMTFAESWSGQLGGRLIAGIGGVVLNVVMSKMVADWFSGREIATAMAIFVNSWPAGIALALLVLPFFAVHDGLWAVGMATVALSVAGLALLALLYAPRSMEQTVGSTGIWPRGNAMRAVIVAGCIWGLFNAALSMVFGYGTALLTERGWTLSAAGSAISLVLWVVALSVPFGGLLSDRTGRPREVMLLSFMLFALILYISARSEHVVFWFVLLGIAASLPAGAIMSLPSRVLAADARATGMGLYFTMFYVFIVAAPILAGILAVRAGTPRAAFDLGVAMLLVCIALVWLYEHFATRHVAEKAVPTV